MKYGFSKKELGIMDFAISFLKANLDDALDGKNTIKEQELNNLEEKLDFHKKLKDIK